jgi:uncharacterized protein (TIGR02246 family)
MTTMSDADRAAVLALYTDLLGAWNAADATAMVRDFAEDGEVVGFDGTILTGRAAVEAEMRRVFADHRTGQYVGIVREVVPLSPDVALVRSVAGVVPAGAADVRPELNSVQRLTAVRRGGAWQIVLYHNTPAQFHGRPELVERLTDELRRARE